MELKQAQEIGARIIEGLKPFCNRIEIAGSVRRLKPEVKDIEIVCIPKYTIGEINSTDLFGNSVLSQMAVYVSGFAKELKKYFIIKGKPTGKYIQFMAPEGINIDLFICTQKNWGYIFSIRTGSAEFSHKVLANGWTKKGYTGKEGMLYKNGIAIQVLEERDLFRLIGLDYIEPDNREV